MPREAKPYYRKAQKRWVCTIDGTRVTLGTNKAEAKKKFDALMKDRTGVRSEVNTLYQTSQVYLDWVQKNRAESTYKFRRGYLKSFIEHVGRTMKVGALKHHHMTKWTSRDEWNSTSRNDAIKTVKRMLNWAVEEQYFSVNPIEKMKMPKRRVRDVVYTPTQWAMIQKHARGSLVSFLDFLWLTGCRPKEARSVEARHVHDDLIVFPPDESKGETHSRVIIMTDEVKAIIDDLILEYPTGVLFRNSKGTPWTKDSIGNRLKRISDKVGFRVIAYGARHSFATNALIRSVDIVSLSHLMGHKDTRMISEVYAHLSQNTDFLRKQARNAVVSSEEET